MNSRKDIFTVFLESSKQFAVQPSPHAWQNLERKLDSQPKEQGRVVLMRWATALAAMFVLVVGVWFVNNLGKAPSFAVEHEPMPKMLQNLVNTEGCNPYCLLLKERKELPAYYANPVRN